MGIAARRWEILFWQIASAFFISFTAVRNCGMFAGGSFSVRRKKWYLCWNGTISVAVRCIKCLFLDFGSKHRHLNCSLWDFFWISEWRMARKEQNDCVWVYMCSDVGGKTLWILSETLERTRNWNKWIVVDFYNAKRCWWRRWNGIYDCSNDGKYYSLNEMACKFNGCPTSLYFMDGERGEKKTERHKTAEVDASQSMNNGKGIDTKHNYRNGKNFNLHK